MTRLVKSLFLITLALGFLVIALFLLETIFRIPIGIGVRMLDSWGGLIVLGLVLLSPLLIFSLFKGRDAGSSDGPFVDNEARQIQELYQQMERLADRVESLETILMDRIKKG